MKAIRVHTPGGLEALRHEDVPVPEPKAGEALVRVEAAGVNFTDIYNRSGFYRIPTPFTLGQEGAGVVERVGSGVTSLRPGYSVAWAAFPGSYAEYAAIPAERLVVIPPGVTTRQAAAVMLQGMTAHYLAVSTFPLRRGHTCLVHAAAGGVGALLVQIAKRRGARVVATVGSESKAAIAREAGADHVLLYRTEDWVAEVKRLTSGRGCDVVYDGVGKDTFLKSLECVAPLGLLAAYGQASGGVPQIDPLVLMAGSKYLTRAKLGDYIATREALLARAGEVLGWVKSGKLKVRIHREYPLASAADAHRDLAGGTTTGKLLLTPSR